MPIWTSLRYDMKCQGHVKRSLCTEEIQKLKSNNSIYLLSMVILIGWLVVFFRVYVALVIFQPYRDLVILKFFFSQQAALGTRHIQNMFKNEDDRVIAFAFHSMNILKVHTAINKHPSVPFHIASFQFPSLNCDSASNWHNGLAVGCNEYLRSFSGISAISRLGSGR